MAAEDYKAFIVEGEAREPLVIDVISKVFFAHGKFKIITLPAGQNLYMLWKKLKEDDFDTDIIEVLREEHKEIRAQLVGLNRNDFSEVYLFFDYDGHQNNLGWDDDRNVIDQMLINFDNETENGKLYISYPMVEALRDFVTGVCGNEDNCFVSVFESVNYKTLSASRAVYPQFNKYGFKIWEEAIDVFAMRLSCLMKRADTVTYDQYIKTIDPYEIFKLEKREIQQNRVFILSAFPEFLVDYFGEKLWRRCVKHTMNQLEKQKCNANYLEMK